MICQVGTILRSVFICSSVRGCCVPFSWMRTIARELSLFVYKALVKKESLFLKKGFNGF